MTLIEGIVLGIFQGGLEWLPVSSQGALVILMVGIFDFTVETATRLSIFLHSGTVLAAVIYFRSELKKMIVGIRSYTPGFSTANNGLITFLILSTLITGLLGYLIFTFISTTSLAGEVFLAIVGIALIFTGLLQRFARRVESKLKTDKDLRLRDTILIGSAQALSVIPGISRSGITTSYLLLRGYSSTDSLRLSFLMSIPTVIIAELGMYMVYGLEAIPFEEAVMGVLFSFIFGLASIHTLLKMASRIRFWIFAIIIGFLAMLPLLGLILV